jgi:hypothetical protein
LLVFGFKSEVFMSVFDASTSPAPKAEMGALRIKRMLAQSFQQLEATLAQVRQIMERHGADNIQSALGDDRTEVANLYMSVKQFVEQHKPGANVPGLPK